MSYHVDETSKSELLGIVIRKGRMATNSSFAADDQLGPTIKGFRGDFDFTLLFEDAFLALVPSALLLLAAPARTLWLWSSSKKLTPSAERLNKVVRERFLHAV